MTRYILVDGTAGAHREGDWSAPGSPFRIALTKASAVEAAPFCWSTDLDGLWGKNTQWAIAGAMLYRTAVPFLCPERAVPPEELLIISFSHGTQVALLAFAAGMRGHLISVNPPIRSDMESTIQLARPNIRRWYNVYGDWKDIWAVLGEIGDGHFGLRRQYPQADRNLKVPGKHGTLLRDPRYIGAWPGLVKEVMR